MRIDLEEIKKQGEMNVEVKDDLKDLKIPEVSFARPAQGRIKISLICKEILIKGDLKAEMSFTCSRCLRKYQDSLSVNIEIKYNIDKIEKPYLDLEEEFRHFFVLSLPMKPLCRKDCKGLCPQCGKNKNSEECKCEDLPANQWIKIKDLYRK